MTQQLTAAGTREVLHDLIHERGLTDWRVVTQCADSTAVIYGRANADTFDESRALRKRKPFVRNNKSAAPPFMVDDDAEASATWCCFLVLPTSSSSSGQLSIQRLVEMEQAAVANAPEGMPYCERTFLCLTDAANVSAIDDTNACARGCSPLRRAVTTISAADMHRLPSLTTAGNSAPGYNTLTNTRALPWTTQCSFEIEQWLHANWSESCSPLAIENAVSDGQLEMTERAAVKVVQQKRLTLLQSAARSELSSGFLRTAQNAAHVTP